MSKRITRRELLRNTAFAGIGVWAAAGTGALGATRSPNEKLHIAGIGAGGQGGWDIGNCGGENIVALCDVDDRRAAESFTRFPKAKRFRDFRKMLEEMDDQIDAVVVGTPDHTHAPPAVMAMKMGKHCYCEKPLAHSVREARTMIELARPRTSWQPRWARRSTPEQLPPGGGAGAVGRDRSGRRGPRLAFGELRRQRPAQGDAARAQGAGLGPLARPGAHASLSSLLLARAVAIWWDFGSGGLGDFGCHYMDLPYWALELRHPTRVEAEGPPVQAENTSPGLIVRYEFPARGKLPPVKMTWYDGGKRPPLVAEAESARLGIRPCCSWARRGCWSPIMASTSCCPSRSSPVSSRLRRAFPNPSAIMPSGSAPARKAAPPPATSTTPARWPRRCCLGNVAYRMGKKLQMGPGGHEGRQLPRGRPVSAAVLSSELGLSGFRQPSRGGIQGGLSQFSRRQRYCRGNQPNRRENGTVPFGTRHGPTSYGKKRSFGRKIDQSPPTLFQPGKGSGSSRRGAVDRRCPAR